MNKENIINYKFNNLDEAIKNLFQDINKKDHPFETTYIVVPSSFYSTYIKNNFLNLTDEVLMNIEILTFEKFIGKAILLNKGYMISSNLESSILIMDYLANIDINEIENIKNYILKDDKQFISANSYDFIITLANLFLEYDNDLFEIDHGSYQKKIYDYVNNVLYSKRHLTLKQVITHKNKKFNDEIKSVYFFGFINYTKLMEYFISTFSDEHKIYRYDYLNVDVNNINENKFEISSSPSLLKEVEYLHSKICSLFLDKTRNVKYSDITVVCRNIKDYEASIRRTFDQDDINFPKLRYNLNSSYKEESDLSSLLKLLFEIKNKGYYTRLDFFNLINNKIIKESQKLDDEFIDNIVSLFVETNIYREVNDKKDFDYIKSRLLLSYFIDYKGFDSTSIKIKDKELIPYSTLSIDNDYLYKFIFFVDCLDKFLSIFTNDSFLTKDKIDKFKEIVDELLNIDNIDLKEYKRLVDIIYYFSISLSFDNENRKDIPFDILFYYLLDNTKRNLNRNNLPYDGITFIEYNLNYILPNKYVFFLGFSSNFYPKKYITSELDIRSEQLDKSKLESDIFNLYYLLSSKLYISYLYIDLTSLEEMYLSSFIKPYLFKFDIKENDIYKLDIDEKRNWKDLFTRNEYKNKDYFLALSSLKNEDEAIDNKIDITYSKKIPLSKFKDYLSNPFVLKINNLFAKEDEDMDDLKDEFEPFEMNALDKFNAFKTLLNYVLLNKITDLDEDKLLPIINRLELINLIPSFNKDVKESVVKSLFSMVKEYIEMLNHYTSNNYEKIDSSNLNIPFYLDSNEEMINIYSYEGYIRYIDEEDARYYFSIQKNTNKRDLDTYIKNYVYSLLDIASIKDDVDKEYKIKLVRGYKEKIDNEGNIERIENYVSFSITPIKAKEILIDIYKDMFDYSSLVFVPLNYINKDLSKYDSYDKYYKSLVNYLSYFKYQNLFSKYDLGFLDSTYDKELIKEINKRRSLVVYFDKNKNNEGGEING